MLLLCFVVCCDQSDPATGKTYYVNTTTNETQWNFPAALPAGTSPSAHRTSVLLPTAPCHYLYVLYIIYLSVILCPCIVYLCIVCLL